MTALAASRNISERNVNSITLGAKAGVVVYAGGFVFNDAGWARGGVPTATTPVLGVSRALVDNTAGANGAMNVIADRGMAYPFVNGTSGDLLAAADIGNQVYAVDDQTAGKTSGSATRPIGGTLVNIDAQGVPWVKVG